MADGIGSTRSVLWVVGALGLAAVAYWAFGGPDTQWVVRKRLYTRTRARAPLPVRVSASSEARPGAARLAVDGRILGSPAPAWSPAPSDPSPWLSARLSARVRLRGVLVHWCGPEPVRTSLRVDAGAALGADERGGGWGLYRFGAPRLVSSLRLVGSAPVCFVQPIYAGTRQWLLAGAGDDYAHELLRGHGMRPLVRLPDALPQALSLVQGGHAIIVGPGAQVAALRTRLLDHVRRGGTLLELGPGTALCGSSTSVQSAAGDLRDAAGKRLPGLRFPTAVADHVPCEGCAAPHVHLQLAHGRPLIVEQRLGGGRCLRILGDLVEAMTRLRQGDPAHADRDMDGNGLVQPQDLFHGQLDPLRLGVPGADRLLERVLALLGPRVRLHLMPATPRGLLIATSDQAGAPAAELTAQVADGEVTFMLDDAALAPAAVLRLFDAGADVGVHPGLDGPPSGYGRALRDAVRAHRQAYVRGPVLVRNARLQWSGYTRMAALQARVGLRMSLDFGAPSVPGVGAGPYINASGLPLRFVDRRGALLPILQQGTQLDDSSFRCRVKPDAASRELARLGARLFGGAQRNPHPIVINWRPGSWRACGGRGLRGLREQARRLGFAVWTAGRWLAHVEAVRNSEIALGDDGRYDVLAAGDDLAVLVDARSRVTLDGKPVQPRTGMLAGRSVAWVSVPSGAHRLGVGAEGAAASAAQPQDQRKQ